jgi:DNA repair protein RadD
MSAQAQEALRIDQPHRSAPRVIVPGWLDTLPPQADCLRDYQTRQIAEIATEVRRGCRRILAQAPTGAGKTHIIGAIVSAAYLAGLRVLILATRTRLVRQLHERLIQFSVPHGAIAAPLPELRNYSAAVQVASVDTLYRRSLVDEKLPLPSADVVIFDEAHLSTADTRIRLLDSYPEALRVGFTATPARKSGLSLGAAFDSLVMGPSIAHLTAAGTLVPLRIWNTPVVSMKELRDLPRDADRDFQASSLGELLSRPKLVGDVLTNWLRVANGKRTLVFAVNKAHGAALLESFLRQGVPTEMVTDQDEEPAREEKIARLEAGSTLVLINCFLMSYGVDVPSIEAIVLARPTRSLTMFLQMLGRGLRASPGKTSCILLDHGHVVENLGLPERNHHWSLRQGSNVNADAWTPAARKATAEQTRTCRECSALWLTTEHGGSCPECGWTAPQRARAIVVEQADLEKLAEAAPTASPYDDRVRWFYREACGWRARRKPDLWNEKPKSVRWWAWCETRAKFRIAESVRKPGAYWDALPAMPSAEVSGWLQHRVIKWARSKSRAA